MNAPQLLPRLALQASASGLVLFVGSRLVEDRQARDHLARAGLRVSAVEALDEARRCLSQLVFDVVVLDLAACAAPLAQAVSGLRPAFDGALLVVGDAGSDEQAAEIDEIVALELGADDFVRAPLSSRRLQARLRALLRRQRRDGDAPAPPSAAAIAGWELDVAQRALRREGRSVALTEGQTELLQCLLRHAPQVVPRGVVQRQICRADTPPGSRSIDVYVHRLRRHLAAAGVHDIRIDAVRGRGFVLVAA